MTSQVLFIVLKPRLESNETLLSYGNLSSCVPLCFNLLFHCFQVAAAAPSFGGATAYYGGQALGGAPAGGHPGYPAAGGYQGYQPGAE